MTEDVVLAFFNEILAISTLRHQNLVFMLGACWDGGPDRQTDYSKRSHQINKISKFVNALGGDFGINRCARKNNEKLWIASEVRFGN